MNKPFQRNKNTHSTYKEQSQEKETLQLKQQSQANQIDQICQMNEESRMSHSRLEVRLEDSSPYHASQRSPYELSEKLKELIKSERKITNEILSLLNEAYKTKAYLKLGYSSLFDWLTKGFGYSNAAAYRRIEAARLLRSVPEVEEKLESGDLNLSSVCTVQKFIKAKEKISHERITLFEKKEILQAVEKKSVIEAEKILFKKFPETQQYIHQEKRTLLSDTLTRHSLNFTSEMSEDLKRVKEILSHQIPDGKDSDVIAYILRFFLKRKDPLKSPEPKKKDFERDDLFGGSNLFEHDDLRKSTSAAEAMRVTGRKEFVRFAKLEEKVKQGSAIASGKVAGNEITPKLTPAGKRKIIQDFNGRCSYKNPQTGRSCGSTYQVQVDHIHPKALGGSDDSENLRVLCKKHNLLEAQVKLGADRMSKYLR